MFYFKRKNNFRNPKIYYSTPKKEHDVNISPFFIKIVLLIIITGVIIWFFFFSSFFKIKNIEISGTLNPEVKNAIEKFYGKNILIIRSGKIEEDLTKMQTSIKSIQVSRGIPDTLKVQVYVRDPQIAWQTQGKTYYIDDSGIVFDLTQNESVANSINSIPLVEDTQNIAIKTGTKLVTSDFVEFTKELAKKLKDDNDITVNKLKVSETTFQLEIETDQNFKIIVSTTESLDNQMAALNRVLDEKKQDIKEYVDLRIIGRVYYK